MAPTPGPPQIPNVPSVLAVFSSRRADGETFSVVCRWCLKESPSTLHPSFDQLGVRRSSVSSPTSVELELFRMDDLFIPKTIISVSLVTSGTVCVALAFSDGSLELRDRYNFNPLQNQSTSKDLVMNMVQAGFWFPQGEDCIDLALSPNNAVAIRLGCDHSIKLMVMEYSGNMQEEENMEIACVALAHQHAYSCNNHLNNDDLLLVAQQYRNPVFNNMFLSEAHRALNLKMDFATESPSERLFRNPLLQRCLSLQNSLDFQGERVNKRLSGKLAWATLHLRVASVAFALTFNNPQRQQGAGGSNDFDLRPEALQTLLGLVRWLMDIMSLTISDLFELAKATKGRTSDLAFVREKGTFELLVGPV